MLREFLPSEDLRPWVDRYWLRPAGTQSAAAVIIPDGCADLVLDLSGSPGEFGEAFAVGTMTRPLILGPGSTPLMFGVRFRPGRAAAFFRATLSEMTDQRIPARDLGSLAAQVAVNENERIAIVESALRRRLCDATFDRRIDDAIDAIVGSAGRARIEDLARRTGVTRQHLARLFDVNVGMSPKTFARVARFRRAMTLGRKMAWADVAATLGYSDQSHLIAEFRELAGTTPDAFQFSNR